MKCCFCSGHVASRIKLNELISLDQIIRNECCQRCYEAIQNEEEDTSDICSYCKKKGHFKQDSCQDCQTWMSNNQLFCLKHDYLYDYNEKMKDYFQRFKFQGDIRMSRCFRHDVYQKLKWYKKNNYVIVPIPISEERLKTRGFNQVEELLKASQIEFKSILHKKKDTISQSEKTKEERLLMPQPFVVSKGQNKWVKSQKILLVDDVYTTGRTILHAYDCILARKPTEIRSFSLSR